MWCTSVTSSSNSSKMLSSTSQRSIPVKTDILTLLGLMGIFVIDVAETKINLAGKLGTSDAYVLNPKVLKSSTNRSTDCSAAENFNGQRNYAEITEELTMYHYWHCYLLPFNWYLTPNQFKPTCLSLDSYPLTAKNVQFSIILASELNTRMPKLLTSTNQTSFVLCCRWKSLCLVEINKKERRRRCIMIYPLFPWLFCQKYCGFCGLMVLTFSIRTKMESVSLSVSIFSFLITIMGIF